MSMKAIIIGKSGQLAWELMHAIPQGVDAVAIGRDDIELKSRSAVYDSLHRHQPQVVINAAAYTAVDKAETEQEAAFALNADAVGYLAEACQVLQCRFIHVSTDFVFDGTKNIAYQPGDPTSPLGIYGASKLAGEHRVQSLAYANSSIVRTSWVYSVHGNNFVRTMLRLMQEKPLLGVVVDQIGCPTSANNLAAFLWALAKLPSLDPIYHWSDLGVASWYDFAVAIQEMAFAEGLIARKIPINPIRSLEYPTPARRPTFSLLDCRASHTVRDGVYWREALHQTIQRLKNYD